LGDLRRPDIAGYVIDPTDDFMTIKNPQGQTSHIRTIQIWADPKRKDAHRDPALRSYLESMFDRGYVGVVRYGAVDGLALIPPAWSGEGWIEFPTQSTGKESSLAEYLSHFGGSGDALNLFRDQNADNGR
jgi:hypothetical protein